MSITASYNYYFMNMIAYFNISVYSLYQCAALKNLHEKALTSAPIFAAEQ